MPALPLINRQLQTIDSLLSSNMNKTAIQSLVSQGAQVVLNVTHAPPVNTALAAARDHLPIPMHSILDHIQATSSHGVQRVLNTINAQSITSALTAARTHLSYFVLLLLFYARAHSIWIAFAILSILLVISPLTRHIIRLILRLIGFGMRGPIAGE